MAYLLWPVALIDLLATRHGSRWFELHLRQAAALGVAATAIIGTLMALPLVLVLLLGSPANTTIIWIYAIALLVDVAAFTCAIGAAIVLSLRASRGQRFEIPFVWAFISHRFRVPR